MCSSDLRIGSEIRTHYPATRHHAMAITSQEAWVARKNARVEIPDYVREVVEEVAFQARQDSKIDKRSGVSQRLPISLLENVVSNAERRALVASEPVIVPRITDIYAALPAITGKFELEYEGELRGADNVARDIIRGAVSNVFTGYFASADLRQFAAALNQASSYGLPLASVMRSQSADLREKRRFRAEERALKIPVKIVFPLVICILPTIFIVLLAPALINIKTIL